MESKKQSILTLLKNRTENYSNKVALGMKNQYGWKELTYSGVGLLSRKLAHYLINFGIKPNDIICIMTNQFSLT